MAENKFGFSEVVDTLGDIVHAAGPDGIRSAFTGRFELVKFLIEAAEVYPTIQEAINDFSRFWQELTDLTPQESLDAAGQIRARFVEPDPVQDKMLTFITNAALTQDYLQREVIGGAQKLLAEWGKL